MHEMHAVSGPSVLSEIRIGGARITALGECSSRGSIAAALAPGAAAILLVPFGGPVIRVNAGARVATPHPAAWASARTIREFVTGRDVRLLVAALPPEALREYGDPDTFGAPKDPALIEPVRAFLAELTRIARPVDPMSEYFLERLLWEMAASLVLRTRGAEPESVARHPVHLRERAEAHIAAYRTDPSLTPGSVARSMNVSLRQLQRVFAADGSSPFAEIRRQRAMHARSMLTDPTLEPLGIEEIARHAGFRDAAQLRRAFQLLGMPSPRSIRASGGGGAPRLAAVETV